MKLLAKIFSFVVGLSVTLGGLICITWFAGSLLIYCLLDRPMWEEATLLSVTIFIFIWSCVSILRKRSSRSSFIKLSDGDIVDEDMEELKGVLDEIDEELRKARYKNDKEEIKGLEDSRKDILNQIEGRQLEITVEKFRRLRKEAINAGRKIEAEEYSKEIEKHEAELKEHGERIEDLTQSERIGLLFMVGSAVIAFGFFILMIPMIMLMVTYGLWETWVGGSEWMRSPVTMIAVIFSCLALACVSVRYVSHFFQTRYIRN